MKSFTRYTANGARWTIAGGAFSLALAAAVAPPAAAQLPDAETFLQDLGFSADQIGQVKSGSFVEGTIPSGRSLARLSLCDMQRRASLDDTELG